MMETVPMDVQNILQNVKFPAKKSDLIQQARGSGAMADQLLKKFGMLPDKEYQSADEVIKELQKR